MQSDALVPMDLMEVQRSLSKMDWLLKSTSIQTGYVGTLCGTHHSPEVRHWESGGERRASKGPAPATPSTIRVLLSLSRQVIDSRKWLRDPQITLHPITKQAHGLGRHLFCAAIKVQYNIPSSRVMSYIVRLSTSTEQIRPNTSLFDAI